MKENKFVLTPSQEVGRKKLKAFLEGPERIFLFTGKPGVGKTTLNKITLKSYIDTDKNEYNSGSNINVAGIAFAHKAKNELGKHIPNVFTFAKAFGLKEVIDEDTGKRTFEIDKYSKGVPIGKQSIPVFVHDEVSQYDSAMLKIVLENTSIFSKIIFMGDRAQLPPVDSEGLMKPDEDSPVFNLKIPESCKHELTERVRQAEGNPILELSDIIREEIFAEKPNVSRIISEIQKPNMVNGMGYNFIKYDSLFEHIRKRDYLDTALIGFRKKKCVDKYNPQIRNYLLNNPINNIVAGDYICMTDNYYKKDEATDYWYCAFNNSDTFKILDVETVKEKYRIGDKVYYFDCFRAKVTNSNHLFIAPTHNGSIDYQKALKEVASLCRKGEIKWIDFWDFKKVFCQWTYGYCLTAYKCQGSTYKTVYVDINDILLTKPLTPKRKLQTIYTAITRAKEDVWFLKFH